jgi:hypothetical protein
MRGIPDVVDDEEAMAILESLSEVKGGVFLIYKIGALSSESCIELRDGTGDVGVLT